MRDIIWRLYVAYLKMRGARAASRVLYRCHRRLRLRIMRAFGAQVGEGTAIHSPFVIMNAKKDFSGLEIGSDSYIGPDTLFDLSAGIHIGDRVTVSMRAGVVTHRDVGHSALGEEYPAEKGDVIIDDDVYLGAGVTVLHGIRIGQGALVAAGAVVTKDVPAHVMVAGVPARQVKTLGKVVSRRSSE